MTTLVRRKEDDLAIRPIAAADAHAVAELTSQLGYERSAVDIMQWIEGLAAVEGRQAAFVGCLGDEVVGWIEVSIERRLQSPEFGLIGGLVVRSGHRSAGIGRRLCRHAEAWTWDHGMTRLRVTSRSSRADAHRFYLRDGYKVLKTSMVFEKDRPS